LLRWEFNIDGTGANGKQDKKKWSAISDTGTSFIVGPQGPLDKLAKAANAKYDSMYGKTKFCFLLIKYLILFIFDIKSVCDR
jgi:hypothetical protein